MGEFVLCGYIVGGGGVIYLGKVGFLIVWEFDVIDQLDCYIEFCGIVVGFGCVLQLVFGVVVFFFWQVGQVQIDL